jgi:hypothetical protein
VFFEKTPPPRYNLRYYLATDRPRSFSE